MKPVSIELEGLFAYRKRARLDLDGVDYFSLEGPTGSGKSSLIDAMILALYGKIPRLGGTTAAPAISAGAERARVSLVFAVGDERYTATRQLERTSSGARATEVRLERGDEVVASGPAEVTSEVTRLLNLTYEDFTRTVVLPQGDFARFLNSTPKERQELLRGLLGLDIYREMGALARAREQLADSRARAAKGRLEELDVPDDEMVAVALERVAVIEELAGKVAEQEGAIDELTTKAAQAESRLANAVDARDRLGRLAAPPRLEELSTLLAKLDDELRTAVEALTEEEARRVTAVEQRSSLPERATLARFADLHQRLRALDEQLGSIDLETVRQALRTAEAGVVEAAEARDDAVRRLDEVRAEHAAHSIARTLEAGATCPVCRQAVATLPKSRTPVGLATMEEAVAGAESALEAARKSAAGLSLDLARAETASERLRESREQLLADLVEAPSADAIPGLVEAVDLATRALAEIEERIEAGRRRVLDLEEERGGLAEEQRSLGKVLMAEREKLADLRPPIAESEDVLVQWKELLTWRTDMVEEIAAGVAELTDEAARLRAALADAKKALAMELSEVGIELDGPPSVALARAEEKARHVVKAHELAREQAGKLKAEIEEAGERAAVAEALARHLRADGFERWMMAGAISDLVVGANSILAELSESSYSLHSDDDGSFDIVDHRNADEIRPVSTLSGGETFLVSLALALSLAETLAAGGGSKLDTIILDEGFGTLDEESLDVVATVLENLSLSGLMVGIITHVKALAGRAPVRFAVGRGPDGSRIEGDS